jgi:diadenosine tetraphosphate (Ap4A) HIT family hydrolase
MARTVLSPAATNILARLSVEDVETLVGCSSYPQFHDMLASYLSGDCPCIFCNIDRVKNEVLYERNGWVAWVVPQRYTTRTKTLSLQLVFFPQRHVRRHRELTPEERIRFFEVIDWAEATFDMPGGAIISRFGDMRYNVGTVQHLHATIMVPNRLGRVLIPIQKSRRMHQAHTQQMYGFLETYVQTA